MSLDPLTSKESLSVAFLVGMVCLNPIVRMYISL
jgi:hypothetical protein